MTIAPYGQTALAAHRASERFAALKSTLADHQAQLSTGRAATTYAGLGSGVSTSLTLRSQISSYDSYTANIADAQVRIGLLNAGVTQAEKLGRSLVTSLPAALNTTTFGSTGYAASPEDGLRQLVDLFNQNLNGRYLFAGRAADTAPVVDYDLMMNGDATRAGLQQLVAERKAADGGADGLGRLAVSAAGATATLGETAAALPFGFKVTAASSTGGRVAAGYNAASPAAASFTVGTQAEAGDKVSVTLGLPDGSTQSFDLVAGTANSETGFAIGATADNTAANIATALGLKVKSLAGSTLAAGSVMAATTNFFGATAANPPLRVVGATPETATSLAAGTTAVVWYKGDVSANPRDAALVRIGDDQVIGIGAEAREPAFQAVLSAFGALAADGFTPVTTTSQARYASLVDRIKTLLGSPTGTTLREITTDMSIASKTMDNAKTVIAQSSAQAKDALAGIEDADPTEAASRLLAAQTKLQASYQITSTVLRLSLADYL